MINPFELIEHLQKLVPSRTDRFHDSTPVVAANVSGGVLTLELGGSPIVKEGAKVLVPAALIKNTISDCELLEDGRVKFTTAHPHDLTAYFSRIGVWPGGQQVLIRYQEQNILVSLDLTDGVPSNTTFIALSGTPIMGVGSTVYAVGGTSSDPYSTYFDGTKNIDVPFVDDGEGNLVPATGNIGTPVIGVRDPATGIFTPDIAYPDAHLIEDVPAGSAEDPTDIELIPYIDGQPATGAVNLDDSQLLADNGTDVDVLLSDWICSIVPKIKSQVSTKDSALFVVFGSTALIEVSISVKTPFRSSALHVDIINDNGDVIADTTLDDLETLVESIDNVEFRYFNSDNKLNLYVNDLIEGSWILTGPMSLRYLGINYIENSNKVKTKMNVSSFSHSLFAGWDFSSRLETIGNNPITGFDSI